MTRKFFNASDEFENETFVRYSNGKIFAIDNIQYKSGLLHVLDLELDILKVVDHRFKGVVDKKNNPLLGLKLSQTPL